MGAPLQVNSPRQETETQPALRRVVVASTDAADADWLQIRVGQAVHVKPCQTTVEAVLEATSQPTSAVVVMFDARVDLLQPAQVVQWLRKYKPQIVVLGMGYANSAQVPLAALRAGVKDFLDIGATSVEEIRKPVWEACMRGTVERVDVAKGKVLTLVSGRAGMGVTTLAVHLAAALASLHETPAPSGYEVPPRDMGVGLIDLGFPLRDGQMQLGLNGRFHMVDAVQGVNRLDKAMLEAALPRHPSGISVLSWPAQAHVLREVSPLSTSTIIQRMREFFAWQVVDLGGLPSQEVLQEVASAADHVWLVGDQSVGGIVSLSEMMKSLRSAMGDNFGDGLVLNRAYKNVGLPPEDVAKRLMLPLLHVLPHREEALLKASSVGMLLSESAPSDPYVHGVRHMASSLMQTGETSAATSVPNGKPAAGKSWLRWMGKSE